MSRFTSYAVSFGALLVFATVLGAGIGSCGHQPPGPSDDPNSIPFDLIVPEHLPQGDFNIISGTRGDDQESFVNDSVYNVTVWRFYAQMIPGPNVEEDYDVLVNVNKLERHRDSDTLRLRSASDTALFRGEQIWKFREPGETRNDLIRFTLPTVDLLDTIGPFEALKESRGSIRSDTACTIRWRRSETGGTIRIEWRGPVNTAIYDAQDFTGSYTIPAAVMNNLRGRGTVIISRSRTVTEDFLGKTIIGTRISQRSYEVRVQ